jgi:hypothetical protein
LPLVPFSLVVRPANPPAEVARTFCITRAATWPIISPEGIGPHMKFFATLSGDLAALRRSTRWLPDAWL